MCNAILGLGILNSCHRATRRLWTWHWKLQPSRRGWFLGDPIVDAMMQEVLIVGDCRIGRIHVGHLLRFGVSERRAFV